MGPSGMSEYVVDAKNSDVEDIQELSEPLIIRDIVKDGLRKDPRNRTDEDIGKEICCPYLVWPTCDSSKVAPSEAGDMGLSGLSETVVDTKNNEMEAIKGPTEPLRIRDIVRDGHGKDPINQTDKDIGEEICCPYRVWPPCDSSKVAPSEAGDMGPSGLSETVVDTKNNEVEDIKGPREPLRIRDIVRDGHRKDPINQTDKDIGEEICCPYRVWPPCDSSKVAPSEAGDMGPSGLSETVVDTKNNEVEDIKGPREPLRIRDIVRDGHRKDPINQTDKDIGEEICCPYRVWPPCDSSKVAPSEAGDMGPSGLSETVVDTKNNEVEDIKGPREPLRIRDIVRDGHRKDPINQTDKDIGEEICCPYRVWPPCDSSKVAPSEAGDMGPSGLSETVVDTKNNEVEEIKGPSEPLRIRDIVRDGHGKDPINQTDKDIGKEICCPYLVWPTCDFWKVVSSEAGDIDPSGLSETVEDTTNNDVKDIKGPSEPLRIKDIVRDCLRKDPRNRTEEDIEQLLEFMQQLPAFSNLPISIKRELCTMMVFQVVNRAGNLILSIGEEFDSWAVILNSSVEVTYFDGRPEMLCMGNSFGVSPTLERGYTRRVMKTKIDDCQKCCYPYECEEQSVCTAQQDPCPILNQVENDVQNVEEEGELSVTREHQELDGDVTSKGHIIIKGTAEELENHLVEEHCGDPTYIEDFLLTCRTFLASPLEVGKKLLEWFNDPNLREKVTQVVLRWVYNYFNDFEGNCAMATFLEEFKSKLEQEKMDCHLQQLNLTCAAKAKRRVVTLLKPSQEAPLPFTILGGIEKGFGIFIDNVESDSKATETGLKCGDQIMEVNGQNFQNIQLLKALEILRANTHLSITVKSNLFVFKELLSRLAGDKRDGTTQFLEMNDKKGECSSIPDHAVDNEQRVGFDAASTKTKTITGTGRRKWKKIRNRNRIGILPGQPEEPIDPQMFFDIYMGKSQGDNIAGSKECRPALPVSGTSSTRNSNLMQAGNHLGDFNTTPKLPGQLLTVWKADQKHRQIIINRDTTAQEAVVQALEKFAIPVDPKVYSLCEISVSAEGVIKQRRLPDQLSKLADRIQLNARYYLKKNNETEILCSDKDAEQLLHESQVTVLQLSPKEIAIQLSLRNLELFHNIAPTEYVDDLFQLKSKSECQNLVKFERIFNQEAFWVATEVLREPNKLKRAKIIKHFIKVALHCKNCNNFNSMFAIISGLYLAPVARLQNTWKKLSFKYQKIFQDLQDLLEPSRNMAKYRNLLNNQNLQYPIIPAFPVIKKDLTSLHEGNDSKVDGVINYEKLRMIANEIRHIGRMASANVDPVTFRTRLLSHGSTNAAVMDLIQTGGHRKHLCCSSFLDARELYEDAQMARRVKHYLENLNLDMDEESLQALSLQREARTNR